MGLVGADVDEMSCGCTGLATQTYGGSQVLAWRAFLSAPPRVRCSPPMAPCSSHGAVTPPPHGSVLPPWCGVTPRDLGREEDALVLTRLVSVVGLLSAWFLF